MPAERPRRPAHLRPQTLEALGGSHDPIAAIDIAHESARILVEAGRGGDPGTARRLVDLVEEIGLTSLAELWADRPSTSLPGALWRLYALREWARRDPALASREYTAGMQHATVAHVVAGAAEPPGPHELVALADDILTGVFTGDLAVALERAASFSTVLSAGRAACTEGDKDADQAAALQQTATDLAECARRWRAGTLL